MLGTGYFDKSYQMFIKDASSIKSNIMVKKCKFFIRLK